MHNITALPVHTSGFSGKWKTDFHNCGEIKLSKNHIEEYEKGKFKLKESKMQEIASVFSEVKVAYFPDTISPFQGDSLAIATKKARQLMYRTHLQTSHTFSKLKCNFFGLDDNRVLVPAYIDGKNKIINTGIHTEGGKGIQKTQSLTYMPSSIRGMLTFYKLFDSGLQIFDNTMLYKHERDLESVTITDMNSEQMPVVFMVDGKDGTAHSARVFKDPNDNSERIIWTIIINSIGKTKLAELIPDYGRWLEQDIERYAKCEKREDAEYIETLSYYSTNRI